MSKRNLRMICIIVIEPMNEYTNCLLTEIWIRPAVTYGLVACFVSETEKKK